MEKNIANDIESVYKKVINSGLKLPPGIYPSVDCFMTSLERLKQVADERKFEQTATVISRALESVTFKCLQNGYKEAIYCGNEFLARQCKIQMMELKSRSKQDEVVPTGSSTCQSTFAPKRFAYAESLINGDCPDAVNNFQDRRNVKDQTSSNHLSLACRNLNESDLPRDGPISSKTNLLFEDRRTASSETSAKHWTFASKILNESDFPRAGTISSKTNSLLQDPRTAQSESFAKRWNFASKLFNESVQPQPCPGISNSSDTFQSTCMKEKNPLIRGKSIEINSALNVPRSVQSSINSKNICNNFRGFNSSSYIPPRNDFVLNTCRPINDSVIGSHSRGVNMNTIIPSRNNKVLPVDNTKGLINDSCVAIDKFRESIENKGNSNKNSSIAHEVKLNKSKRTPGLKKGSIPATKKSSERLSQLKRHRGVEYLNGSKRNSINDKQNSSDMSTKSKTLKKVFDNEEKRNNSISNRRKTFDVDESKTNRKNNDIKDKEKKSCMEVEQSPKQGKKNKDTPGSLKQNDSNISRKQRLKFDTLSTPVRRYSKLSKTVDSVKVNRSKRKHDSEYLSDVNSTLRPRVKRLRALSSTPGTNQSSCKNVSKSRRHKGTVDSKVSCANSMDYSAVTTDMSSAYYETPKSTLSNRRGNVRIVYKRNLFSTPRDRIRKKWLK